MSTNHEINIVVLLMLQKHLPEPPLCGGMLAGRAPASPGPLSCLELKPLQCSLDYVLSPQVLFREGCLDLSEEIEKTAEMSQIF